MGAFTDLGKVPFQLKGGCQAADSLHGWAKFASTRTNLSDEAKRKVPRVSGFFLDPTCDTVRNVSRLLAGELIALQAGQTGTQAGGYARLVPYDVYFVTHTESRSPHSVSGFVFLQARLPPDQRDAKARRERDSPL